jgi:hypothetical protein
MPVCSGETTAAKNLRTLYESTEHLIRHSPDVAISNNRLLDIDQGKVGEHVMQVTRVVFMIGVKALLDGTLGREAGRERNRDAELARLSEAVRTRHAQPPTAEPASFGENRRAWRGSGEICDQRPGRDHFLTGCTMFQR